MTDFFSQNSWVFVFSVPVVAIVGYYWHAIHRDKVNADLKREMIERGMSAEDIVRVLEAGQSEDDNRRVTRRTAL
jgi:hypothetical protein